MNYFVAGTHSWNRNVFNHVLSKYPGTWYYVDKIDDLNLAYELEPRYIFFIHWSEWVPEDITENFECVCFHPTDLPFGRGGSPIQNLIWQDFEETKVTAFRMTDELDAGPIYCQEELSLLNSAQEIFEREMMVVAHMIKDIIDNNPIPEPQEGESVYFTRRKASESEIHGSYSLEEIYNLIRMLDAEDYPKAFVEKDGTRYEFSFAHLEDGKLTARVEIIKDAQ